MNIIERLYFQPEHVGEEEEIMDLQETPVSGKHYEWQLSDGRQWLTIDNDHVIETHYCQPGAKGITIDTDIQGQVFIDFDKLQTRTSTLSVQRLSVVPQGQTEDVGWYFRDDQLWREYGSQGSSMLASSVSSGDVERQFALNPQGTFRFTVGSTGYRLDFSAMTQTNCITGLCRNIRRRPKFTPNSGSLNTTSVLPTASSSQLAGGGYRWEFMGDEGEWTEYQAHVCSYDSTAIEGHYRLNPGGQLQFMIKRFSYALDFSRMCQVNNKIGTKRAVRRTFVAGSQQSSISGATPRWQFQDICGIWKDYSKVVQANHRCSVSSRDIELLYTQNQSGKMSFTTKNFSYELDFSAMTQRNLSTNTSRPVRRLDH
ncbi:uncharacterized protein si:ch211-244b2.3 isoform X1 [Scophthalmus maximus]|uniref:uncharacterized protein si:ch211-244b2.3 isoform X1 n=1 Tax=Scophthalmus maximus TaxID=52904 RepID=UPI0015E0FBAD|nr:uncharacterized protein si:ch211-244b2.3 isoform X1 [Scophthalmus maximus]